MILASESYLANDFRVLITGLSGLNKPYILRAFEVVGRTGLTISVRVMDSLVFNPLDGNGSFYAGTSDDSDVLVDLPADQQNVFVQGRFTNQTQSPANSAFWDPLALQGDSIAGTEFTAAADTQDVLLLSIEVNTVGFSEDAIPILRATTSASAVTSMVDARDYLWRLGTGGPTPDPLHKFPWSNTRSESVASGVGVGQEADSPFRSSDSTGVRNDKGFRSLKDWMDAVMTRLAEIAGNAIWYDSSSSSSAITNLTLNTLFFDSESGHSIQPDDNVSFIWTRDGGNLVLESHGLAPVSWQSNYSKIHWSLGGTFTSNTPGGSRSYTNPRFISPSPVENGNIYLLLEREVPKGSGGSLNWANNSVDTNLTEARAVSGVADDFTNIAIGDYIRKESEGYQRYYKIVKMSDGTTITTTADYVANSSIIGLELEIDIIGGATSEPLRYFRSKYDDTDLYADQTPGTYTYTDINYYWLGRRLNDLFILRGYGAMQEGEEVTILNDSFVNGSGGNGDLILEKGFDALYDGSNFTQGTGAEGYLLTIRRRKRNNTVDVPSSGDNSGAYLTYFIDKNTAPVGTMSSGQDLWAKLDDANSGELVSGSVTDPTDDEDNTNTNTNKWEIRNAANTPLRTYDNRDVYLIARCITITLPGGGSKSVVMFTDGSTLADQGTTLNNKFAVEGDTRFKANVALETRADTGILFIKDDASKNIDDDVANLFYNKTSGIFGLQNFRFTNGFVNLNTPADVDFLPNLGAFTLDIGAATSTTRIRGDLIVDGTTVSENVSTIQSDDKRITLGVGDLNNDSQGAGIDVADNTVEVFSAAAVNSQIYLDLNYSLPHGYSLGQKVGISSNTTIKGIPAGEISGEYTVVASGSVAGDAQIMTGSQLRIWTNGTATSSGTVTLSPPTTSVRSFDMLSWMKITDSSGTEGGMTSWSWRVKNTAQEVSMTPVVNYGTIPTGYSTKMIATRIPFVNADGQGPGGANTTLDFSDDFKWNDSTKVLTVNGDVNVGALTVTSFYMDGIRDVSTTQSLTITDLIVRIDTSSNVADITLTLPSSNSSNKGQYIRLKDVGRTLSQFNRRCYLKPNGSDTIDTIYTNSLPVEMSIDGMEITVTSMGDGTWILG